MKSKLKPTVLGRTTAISTKLESEKKSLTPRQPSLLGNIFKKKEAESDIPYDVLEQKCKFIVDKMYNEKVKQKLKDDVI